jgi:hypothetical protein
MSLMVDTSWWTRYRDDSHNPDLDPNFEFSAGGPRFDVGQLFRQSRELIAT